MGSNAKLAVVAALLILLQVSCVAVARHHHGGKKQPDPCGPDAAADSAPGTQGHHKERPPHCPKPGAGGGGGTPAVMTVNGFQKGQDGGGPAACDGKFHSNKDMIVALSTRWYAGGKRCHHTIRITSKHNGRTVEAKVVDECDSRHGCKDNIVDTSEAVWKALGLDSNIGEVPVTWSDA
ncbi:putative ripening-related protein 6 [Brachypodium distachyon]|uniref:RlpA-like protein double-psi beta-barrel domain-containing protein n=1 Tax=Brachypodium distachyon TaxID=15368 RepID=I1I4Y5_BRADI|nr:putative ripening-related protein 6 [Brachypodium distachyon]KQJ97229.1 hypothetical protein BRADI_3g29550v3 [Brachypodium distachyon]|eukprot:XP_003571922.1 putative ripening-related protein 6 [Brachypodium distachyon]